MGFKYIFFLLVSVNLIVADTNYNGITLNKSVSLFASRIFKELSENNPDDNILISPVSIQLILGLLKLGAEGITSQELSDVLAIPIDDKTLKEHLYKLQQNFIRNDLITPSKEPNITIANAIYVRRDVRVSEQFYQTAKKYLNVDIRSLENQFNNETIVRQINEWISTKTNGHIKRVLNEMDVNADTVMLLLNTLYFKGKWRDNGFNVSETKYEHFYFDAKRFVDVPMMRTSDYFLIGRYKHLNITYLELPYSGKNIDDTGDYVFAIYLPDIYENGSKFLTDNIEYLLLNQPEITNVEQVDVRIPRFKIRTNNHLKKYLQNLGLKHAFSNANFYGLTVDKKSVQITDVIHNTALEITEEGTEASAVTVIGIDDRIFSQPLPFIANRPFLFVLKQKSTNIILFVGHYQQVKQE